MLSFTRAHDDLPIFRARSENETWYYTPGAMTRAQSDDLAIPSDVSELAQQALDGWQSKHSLPYSPSCLTLYLSNRCNLSCSYCYSSFGNQARVPTNSTKASKDNALPIISIKAVAAASRLVADNCQSRGLPFSLVIHGGGEPTATFEALRECVKITQKIAADRGLPWSAYISTNGVMSARNATWLGNTFGEIGLSCDGPPKLHDQHRRTPTGRATSSYVERTALVLASTDAKVQVRATVTPGVVERMSDIVRYAKRNLFAGSVHIEPAYAATGMWQVGDAGTFVAAFLQATSVGQEIGLPVSLSGVRLDELHGPHCNISKEVLSITPDGSVTACFLTTDGRLGEFGDYVFGQYSEANDNYSFDESAIEQMLTKAAAIPAECQACVNVMHCARDCPDKCSLKSEQVTGGFRCEVQRQISRHWLDQLVTDMSIER